MSAEGNFEKTRIQDPEQAHQEANMLKAQTESLHLLEERPTVEEYNAALAMLDKLQKEAENESPLLNKITDPMRRMLAGFIAGTGMAGEILGLAMVNVGNKVLPLSEDWKKRDRQALANAVERLGESYESLKETLASARERLEILKAEAQEVAKKETEQ